MAATVNLSRNTKLYVSTVATGHAVTDTFEIPILDGYSFTQNTESQNITLNEAGAAPVRGQKVFNTALNPVDISFVTYVRPFMYDPDQDGVTTPDTHNCVERILWDAVAGTALNQATTATATELTVDFSNSEVHELLPLYLYFTVDNVTYVISGATITAVTIDFSIDGIAQLQWTAQGVSLAEGTAPAAYRSAAAGATTADLQTTNLRDADFIKNKLSTVSLTAADTATFPGVSSNGVYNLALTGGSITIENGTTFLTPAELGIVNKPIGSFTGTRAISGNITCYLRTGATLGQSGDLFSDMATATDVISNAFALTVSLGGASAPKLELVMAQAHLNIPTINVEDVVASDIQFTAQGGTNGIEDTDELLIKYYAS